VIDITCPRCGHVYHASEAHLGRAVKCVACGEIVPLKIEEHRPPAMERPHAASGRSSQPAQAGDSAPSTANVTSSSRTASWPSLGFLSKQHLTLLALAAFFFVLAGLRPPFQIGRAGVKYAWLWSHRGSRIELTRLLVEWVLIGQNRDPRRHPRPKTLRSR
jgi:hypothetical protein